MINKKWSFTTAPENCHNNKKISEISFGVFAFALKFVNLPQEEILKIF